MFDKAQETKDRKHTFAFALFHGFCPLGCVYFEHGISSSWEYFEFCYRLSLDEMRNGRVSSVFRLIVLGEIIIKFRESKQTTTITKKLQQ